MRGGGGEVLGALRWWVWCCKDEHLLIYTPVLESKLAFVTFSVRLWIVACVI